MSVATTALPRPLVRLTKAPHRWLWNKLQLLVWALVLAYIGMLMVAGLYYLVFQVDPTMNSMWHAAVSDSELRHNIRDIGEGLLGGLLAQQVVWNHYRKKKAPNAIDRFEMRLHIANVKDEKPLSFWQLLASPFLAILYAIPGFLIGLLIIVIIKHNTEHMQALGSFFQQTAQSYVPAPSVWGKLESVVTDGWDKKLLGYGAAFFFGRRPVKGVFDDLQLWVVQQMVSHGKGLRGFLPPTFQARYNDVLENGVAEGQAINARWAWLLWPLGVISIGLALFGAYVMIFIANG